MKHILVQNYSIPKDYKNLFCKYSKTYIEYNRSSTIIPYTKTDYTMDNIPIVYIVDDTHIKKFKERLLVYDEENNTFHFYNFSGDVHVIILEEDTDLYEKSLDNIEVYDNKNDALLDTIQNELNYLESNNAFLQDRLKKVKNELGVQLEFDIKRLREEYKVKVEREEKRIKDEIYVISQKINENKQLKGAVLLDLYKDIKKNK